MNTTKGRILLTTKEVASFLHVNEKMIYNLVQEKGLPATKVTGKWLFPKAMVEEWLETHISGFRGSTTSRSTDEGILLFAGSDDPLFQQTIALFHSIHNPLTAFFANLGSMGGLNTLKRGQCHIATCHLLQEDAQEYNFEFAARELNDSAVIMNFSRREQGLILAPGNPKNIQTVTDLAKPGITIVNRPLGTGTRLLLDHEIAVSDIASRDIDGYQNEVSRHVDAGLAVKSGKADAAPAIRAVAGMLDLDFLPLRWERFDLLIDKRRFFDENIQRFLGVFHEKAFNELAGSFVGYDIKECGKMLFSH